ncbi:MAG: membrane trafficking protein [Clostridia bacterium]|nr:membrane trafficking protein [Clostridia bacterium]
MNDMFKGKLADILGKMDEKVLQAKLNAALEMLKKGNTEDLAKQIGKIDKKELMEKMNEFDESKLKNMNINMDEIKKNISSADLDKLSKLVGDQGDEIVKKIKTLLNQK